jgi:hypothetical protein
LISQGQARRSILGRSRVIHFISYLPVYPKFENIALKKNNGKADPLRAHLAGRHPLFFYLTVSIAPFCKEMSKGKFPVVLGFHKPVFRCQQKYICLFIIFKGIFNSL